MSDKDSHSFRRRALISFDQNPSLERPFLHSIGVCMEVSYIPLPCRQRYAAVVEYSKRMDGYAST